MRPERIRKKCLCCGGAFSVPPCRDWRENCCSSVCKRAYRLGAAAVAKASRERKCETCGGVFHPRASQLAQGGGRFCSKTCMLPHIRRIGHTPSANSKRGETYKQNLVEGKFAKARGANNPCWKGGHAAYRARRVASGKEREALRKYRATHPEKVREFSARRSGRKIGRLPRGTIERIRRLQRNKCACCCRSLAEGFHVDHINPLAKGGSHCAMNIQLLCPPCNLHKSDRDPIMFAQMMGRLL